MSCTGVLLRMGLLLLTRTGNSTQDEGSGQADTWASRAGTGGGQQKSREARDRAMLSPASPGLLRVSAAPSVDH